MLPAEIHSVAIDMLSSLFPQNEVRERARSLGVVKRAGKVDAYALLMVVLLGLVVRGPTAIAQLGHVYASATGTRLARSSFWDRFTPELSLLFKETLTRITQQARKEPCRPPGILSCFRDVLATDASVVKVNDALRSVWKGTRRNSAAAAVKVHASIRVFTGELVKFRLTQEAYADCKAYRADTDLRGVLTLFDKGYASPSLWRRIASVGGYFLTRMPAGWNPEVESENRRHRGRARRLVGKKLRKALGGLKREVVDVNCRFKCRSRRYAKSPARFVYESFRVVALRMPETGEYALYATNVPEDMLRGEDIREVYRLRWEVETFFKLAKSGCALNELPSSKKPIVETFLYAALLRATLSMRARNKLLAWFAPGQLHRVNHMQWVKWWNRQLPLLLDSLLARAGVWDAHAALSLLFDPNRARPPTRAVFASAFL